MERVQTLQPTLIVLEATGRMEVPLAVALAVVGLPVEHNWGQVLFLVYVSGPSLTALVVIANRTSE